jgi:hypothetical protein
MTNRPLLFGAELQADDKPLTLEELQIKDLKESSEHRKTTLTLAVIATAFTVVGFFLSLKD